MNAARSLLLAAALALGGCSTPETPTITPISGKVTKVDAAGITVEAKLEGHNPNDFDIAVKSATAKVKLDKSIDLGTVTVSHAVTLPAHKKTRFDVPLTVKWSDAGALLPLATSNRDVPYEAEGHVKVKASSVELELPFKITGIVTHQQLSQAAKGSMPKIEGLPLPF